MHLFIYKPDSTFMPILFSFCDQTVLWLFLKTGSQQHLLLDAMWKYKPGLHTWTARTHPRAAPHRSKKPAALLKAALLLVVCIKSNIFLLGSAYLWHSKLDAAMLSVNSMSYTNKQPVSACRVQYRKNTASKSKASSRNVCAVWGQHNCGLYSTGLVQRFKK